MNNSWCSPKNAKSVYDITNAVVASVLSLETTSFEYASSVLRCIVALSFSSHSSLFLFPSIRNSARKNTPRISHGLTQTLIANAPATALITKFVEIVSMSANASCFSHAVYNCDSAK